MKAVFVIPVFKRLELTRLCVERLVKQGKKLSFDVICVGDKEAQEYCKGATFYKYDNDPLSYKLNFALSKCKGYDRVVIWGSDNFATDEVLKPLVKSKEPIIGYDSIYFYSNRTKRSSKWDSSKMSIGVGRSYSREVLERFDYRLYRKKANSGLDTMAYNLYRQHFNEKILSLKEGYLLDVKHEMNITNPNIVRLGESVEPFWHDLIVQLDKIQPKDKEHIERVIKKPKGMVKIELVKDVAGMKKGLQKTVDPVTANNMVRKGYAKKVASTKSKEVITKKEDNGGNTKKKSSKKGGKQGTRKASKK